MKRDSRGVKPEEHEREFVAWDGEGINLKGAGKPQSYVLFGSTKGSISSRDGLSTIDCLEHIIETGKANPRAVHVGFAFSYDANMIVRSLSPASLGRLHRDGWVRIRAGEDRYTVTFAKGKYFRVTKYDRNYSREHNPTAKTTVQIFDIFSFFASSFIKAYEDLIGPVPDIIKTGKAGRGEFKLEEFEEVEKYWSVEIRLLAELAEELRRRVYNAGLRITQWHGPGALASYAMGKHGIKAHMADCGEQIRLAARYAYAGGRFELYKVGRVSGPVYGVDINSAYPYAITQLPSLTEGEWKHVTTPTRIAKFGVYHINLRRFGGFSHAPSPLFHRDRDHNISFPWFVEGWYWGPEARIAAAYGADVLEGWEYTGASTRPFDWVADMYLQRRDWKMRGISAQLALKLCMNSMYGKLAQRLGWDEEKRRIPPWHQLEWAGWITSFTRAKLYEVLMRIPFEHLVAVETDGIYTTFPPDKLGIVDSTDLGGWEISEYSEVLYVQSGLAWLCSPDGKWTDKRRGLDKGSFTRDDAYAFARTLRPHERWEPFIGSSTRFVGLGQALMSSTPLADRHCVWETTDREISPGNHGKRVHIHRLCAACEAGLPASEMAHDLVIRSLSTLDPLSVPHSIPWEDAGRPRWREHGESEDEQLTLQYV